MDPACAGPDDRGCVWGIYDTDDQGRRERTIATFRTRAAADEYMGPGPGGYSHMRQIKVYDTVAEVRAVQVAAAKTAALAKLTAEERRLLGLA
jgi:hypothetical protein